jgi:hypothetical protein
LAVYAVAAERDRAPASQDGYHWSTTRSAAFLAAIIVLALILASLLALVIELR